MKELSIEEKAKRYDEAKLRMSAAYNSNRCTIGLMNEIFPELRESGKENKDKKIIKALTQLVNDYPSMDLFIKYDIHSYEVITWLEKQNKQKSWSEEDENK